LKKTLRSSFAYEVGVECILFCPLVLAIEPQYHEIEGYR
jgi:hypothetical protein